MFIDASALTALLTDEDDAREAALAAAAGERADNFAACGVGGGDLR